MLTALPNKENFNNNGVPLTLELCQFVICHSGLNTVKHDIVNDGSKCKY